jgi:hypothetical protein
MKNPLLTRSHSNAACPAQHKTAKVFALAGSVAFFFAAIPQASAQIFTAGNLVVTRSVYSGTAGTVTIGQALPGGGTAVANGSYPGVWANDTPDSSFGVTSPIYLDEYTLSGTFKTTLPLASTAIGTAVNTSFSSKSELALNLSASGESGPYLTFMAYVSPANALDVSNSNTFSPIDPSNPVAASNYRAVVQVDMYGNATYTSVNSYSGNNGRAAILVDGTYYLVGNAGNSGKPAPSGTVLGNLSNNTGVQLATPSVSAETTTVIGTPQGTFGNTTGYQNGFTVTSIGDPADKTGKDDNFRGETVFNNTLYVTKGSGSNGVNTVYQVGTEGILPTASTAATTPITILPGFPTTLASASSGVSYPFGLFFANATTLYVTDEGADNPTFSGSAITNPGQTGGLQKWSLVSGTWVLDYELTAGLNLGTQYTVSGYTGPSPAIDGLRNLTGVVNGDGTVTLYAITSTESLNGDQGADPNQLEAITDNVSFTTAAQAAGESFTTTVPPTNLTVLRGVAYVTPSAETIPALPTWALASLTFVVFAAGAFYLVQKRSKRAA